MRVGNTDIEKQYDSPSSISSTDNRDIEKRSLDDDADEIHLRHYVGRVYRRKALVLAVTGVLLAAAAAYLFTREKMYRAEARVQIDFENTAGIASAPAEPSTFVDRAYFNTQLELLSSPGLIRRAVVELDLPKDKDFLPPGSSAGSLLATGVAASNDDPNSGPSPPEAEAEMLMPYVAAIQKSLDVQPVLRARQAVKDTRLIEIGFNHSNPDTAARVANALADALANTNLDKKMSTNTTENRYLRNNINELSGRIKADEERLLSYGRNNHLPSLEGSQNTVVERLVGLNRQLLEAENERKLAEAAHNAAREPGAAEALAEEGAKQIPETDAKLDELRQRRALLLVEATEKFPEVREVDSQIAVLEQQTKEKRKRATGLYTKNLETRYRQAAAREQAIKSAFETQRGETLDQNATAINYRITQQSIDTNRKLLDSMQQRANENEMLRAKVPNNIAVVDYASAPNEPVNGQRLQYLALAALLAFGTGVGLALVRDYFDDAVHSTDELEKTFSLPALAVVPRVKDGLLASARRRMSGSSSFQIAPTDQPATVLNRPELILASEADSPISEAFRRLKTALLLAPGAGRLKTILVTSSEKNEGKTTTAANLATSLAQSGALVLIIDADLRNPSIEKIFRLEGNAGLADILTKHADGDPAAYIVRHSSRLHILPAGTPISDSADWLSSAAMAQMLERFAGEYDHVIIDSPPIGAFADSTILASMSDGVLLVVQGSRISQEAVRHSVKALRMVGARIAGIVMNKVGLRSDPYYGYNS